MKVSRKLSERICDMMDHGRAPIARRTPISCVRSRTMTSMMLLTPTMPASSVPRPTIHVSRLMPFSSPFTFSNCSPRLKPLMAFLSSGEMMWLAAMMRLHFSSMSWMRTSSSAMMVIISTEEPSFQSCCTSELGTAMVVSGLLPMFIEVLPRSMTPTTVR